MTLRRFGLLAVLGWTWTLSVAGQTLQTAEGLLPLSQTADPSHLAAGAGIWTLPLPVDLTAEPPVLWTAALVGGGSLEAWDAAGHSLGRLSWPAYHLDHYQVGLILPTGAQLRSLRLTTNLPTDQVPHFELSSLTALRTSSLTRVLPDPAHRRLAFGLPPTNLTGGPQALHLSLALRPGATRQPRPILITQITGNRRTTDFFTYDQGAEQVYLYPDSRAGALINLDLPDTDLRLAGVEKLTIPPKAPIPADLGTILDTTGYPRRSAAREWFSWSLFPNILLLETWDYQLQDRYFLRLAYFVEKVGFRGRLMTNGELDGKHGWNAHDYKPDDLANFFQTAQDQAFPLNGEELELRDQLTKSGLLIHQGDRWVAGQGAILGISQQSNATLRRQLLTHEASHGVYFVQANFRQAAQLAYDQLAPIEKDLWQAFMVQADYDPDFEYLMQNEFMAYCLQQPAEEWKTFLKSRVWARSLAKFPAKKPLWSESFGKNGDRLTGFLNAYRTIDEALQRLTPLRSGQLALINRTSAAP